MQNFVVMISTFLLASICFASQQDARSSSASAVSSYVRTSDPVAVQRAIDTANDIVRRRANDAPNESYLATLVSNKGLSIADVHKFAKQRQFEIVRIEIKVPLSSGVTRTISIGANDLLSSNGSVEDRLTRSVGRKRLEYQQMAKKLSGQDAEKYFELAYADMSIYKMDLVGTARGINNAFNDKRVMAIFPEENTERAMEFADLKSRIRDANPDATWSDQQ